MMHVLIIPSEEFVPEAQPVAGIFQYHQATILQEAGFQVGAISIRLEFSIFMLFKGIGMRFLGKNAGNATDRFSIKELWQLTFRKLFRQADFIVEEKKEGVRIFRVEGLYYLPPSDANNLFGWVKAGMAGFKTYLDSCGRPDIIHAHNALYAGVLARKISKRYNIPYIITEHSTMFARNLINGRRLVNPVRKSYSDAAAVFAVSKPFCELLHRKFKQVDFQYLPNVIDPFLERKKLITSAHQQDQFVFLNIAELHPKKNQQLLINAFSMLLAKSGSRKIKLVIAGDGVDRELLMQLIQQKKLQDHVEMPGLLNREQVCEAIERSHCFVLSSNYETFGVVLIEAMLFGKPVISTKCGGPEDFVTGETGLLVEKKNEELLAEAMFEMILKYDHYNSTEIRSYAVNTFGREIFLERMNHIYKTYSSSSS